MYVKEMDSCVLDTQDSPRPRTPSTQLHAKDRELASIIILLSKFEDMEGILSNEGPLK